LAEPNQLTVPAKGPTFVCSSIELGTSPFRPIEEFGVGKDSMYIGSGRIRPVHELEHADGYANKGVSVAYFSEENPTAGRTSGVRR
jgi:hypothetical protein